MSAIVNDTPTSEKLTSAIEGQKGVMLGSISDVMLNKTPTPHETEIYTTAAVVAGVLAGNGSNGSNDVGDEYGAHLPFTSNLQREIKHELAEQINTSPMAMQRNECGERSVESPKIRLTPTSKLMATPNTADPKRKFICPYENCNKSYGKSSHLRSHLTWHTGIKPFVCQAPSCGKGFTRSDELNRHVRTHTGEKPFECVQCTKKFSRSDHLTKHLATHTKQLQNGFANKRPRQSQNSERQYRSNDVDAKKVYVEMKSPAENMRFSDGMHFMAALIGSVSQIKQEEQENHHTDVPPTVSLPFDIKSEQPENDDDYRVAAPHRQITASESEDDIPQELIVPVSEMICPLTPEIKTEPSDEANTPEALHAARLTTDNSTAVAAAAAAVAVAAHYDLPHFGHFMAEMTHDPESRPFKCNQCHKCFKRQDDLNRHVRTHTGEKPYACTECERRFVRSDHLKKHMNTHTKLAR